MSSPPEPGSSSNQGSDASSQSEDMESSDETSEYDDYAGCAGSVSVSDYGDSEQSCDEYCDGCNNCEEEMTPSSIPDSCPYWECCWDDVPLTISRTVTLSPSFIQLPQHIKAIRLGVGSLTLSSQKEVIVYCYLNHLEKQMGWDISAVTCFYEPDKFVELKSSDWTDGSGGELLSASITGRPKDEAAITLNFRFYLASSTRLFEYHRFDGRFGGQLWEAAVKEHMTDVVFLVGDRSFSAHKFILASRSPVFSVMFGTDMVESRTGRVKVDDVDPDTFQQFLRFLYTGQLEEPASEELGIIADKYDVKTLTAICKSSSFAFGANAEDLFASVQSAKVIKRGDGTLLLRSPDVKMAAIFWISANVSFTEHPSWAVCKEGGHSVMTFMSIPSGSHCISETQPHSFQGSFVMPDQFCLSGGLPDKDASRIVEVFCSSKRYTMDGNHRYFTRMKLLSHPPGPEDAQPAMQKFTATAQHLDLVRIVESSDVNMEFHVCYSPSIPEFRYAFRDSHLSRNLWSSSVNKEWTDVDFQVGDKTFSAHRALLTARCPALIPPGSNDSSAPVKVKVEKVESFVFEDLLHFLYTGELKSFPPSEALYKAAVTYEVDLLQRFFEIGQPKPKVADDITPDCPME